MKLRKSATALLAGAVTMVTGLAVASALPAFAGAPHSAGKVAAPWTPWLLPNPTYQNVDQLVPCGDSMFAVGRLSAIGQGAEGNTYTRGSGFSFSQTTGKLTSWDPQANGEIHSIALSPDCSTAYIGGTFTMVHGTAAQNFAAVDTKTGAVKWVANAGRRVYSVVYTSEGVLVGGNFNRINGVARSHLASLDPTTGEVTDFANLPITGTLVGNTTKIFNMQLSHAGDRLLVEGVFTAIAGQPRQQLAMFDLKGQQGEGEGSNQLSLDAWYAPEFNAACNPKWSFYARAGAWSPDDAVVYDAATGYKPATGPGSLTTDVRSGLCDAAGAFPSTAATVQHFWINYTGCDSYFSIVADANQVYVGGHERWANNPGGCDHAGPGAVARPGLGALDPATGQATKWNPTRSLGHGADDLVLTPGGLWVASDTFHTGLEQHCAHQGDHGGICFLPYPA